MTMRMLTPGTWQTGDAVTYVTDDGRYLTGTVTAVETRRTYTVIPTGTLGILDKVDES